MGSGVSSQIVGIVLQVGLVVVLAAALWALFGRKKCSFRAYVGLIAAPWQTILFAAAVGVALPVLVLAIPSFRAMASGADTVVGSTVAQLGPAGAIPILLLLAIFKTAFAEELLFRGIIGKRLIAWLGFNAGNAIQALLFAAVHLLIFTVSARPDLVSGIAFIGLVTLTGWVNGWLNERRGDGSILPGWTAHAIANSITYLFVAHWVL